MSKDIYRFCKIILLAIVLIGALVIALRWAENGRYVQFDLQKTYSPSGSTALKQPPNYVIDTRTGQRIPTE